MNRNWGINQNPSSKILSIAEKDHVVHLRSSKLFHSYRRPSQEKDAYLHTCRVSAHSYNVYTVHQVLGLKSILVVIRTVLGNFKHVPKVDSRKCPSHVNRACQAGKITKNYLTMYKHMGTSVECRDR